MATPLAPYTLPRLVLLLSCMISSPLHLGAQLYEDNQSALYSNKGNGLYASAGLGFIDLKRGTGINLPLGLSVVLPKMRLIGTANLLDIGLMQEQRSGITRRYVRWKDSRTNRSFCVDTQRANVIVSDLRCSGGTDFLYSIGIDLSFVPVETQFFGGRMGKIFGGVGFRFLNPETVYATLGILYDRPGGGTGGIKLAVGKEYVFAGVVWGMNLKRILSRF
jgi:hypothetical protein